MSYCREEGKDGKDRVMFATREDLETPIKEELQYLAEEDDEAEGLILPNGDINWNCPCLGGMASGPCGLEFREAFSCFHYSTAEPKGSDCINNFRKMQECMMGYPTLYPMDEKEPELPEENGDEHLASLPVEVGSSEQSENSTKNEPESAS